MEKALFDTFPSMDYAQELIQILEENKIEFSLVEHAHNVDITFTGNKISQIQLFLDTTKFNIVQKLREKKS